MATRDVRLLPKRTAISGRIPTGTTGNELNLIKQGELAVNTADWKIFSYDGSSVFEFGAKSYLGLSGGTITGTTFISSVSATTISGGTIYSGNTNLDVFFTQDRAQINSKANRSGDTFTGNVVIPSLSATTISANTISASTYYMETEQIFGNVIKSTPPISTGNTWTRNTDYEYFIYDGIRGKWLSTGEVRLTGARASNNVSTQFLRVEDSQIISTNPFRVPYDATIVRVVMNGDTSQTWRAMITTGSTMATDYIISLGVASGVYTAKTDYNININSGQTLYIGMSGSSISQPRVDVYFKRRGQ